MGAILVGGILLNNSPVTLDDVTPLARLINDIGVVAVGTSSPFQTIDDLVNAMKESLGAVLIGGGVDHIAAALIARSVGLDPKGGQLHRLRLRCARRNRHRRRRDLGRQRVQAHGRRRPHPHPRRHLGGAFPRQGWEDAFLGGEDFTPFLAEGKERQGGVLRDIGLIQ